jgi:outer membrane protein OmpA-like peptidoglycan-associated protein
MIQFNESETDVPLASTGQLDTLAKRLTDNPALRVNIMAYAGGPETTGIYPKRVSLARGIAVRNYLTGNKGIDIERVNVKAMGNKNEGNGPGERVDVFVLK